jgi:hypothetical protein
VEAESGGSFEKMAELLKDEPTVSSVFFPRLLAEKYYEMEFPIAAHVISSYQRV